MLPGKWHSCCAKEIEEALSLSLKVSVATGIVPFKLEESDSAGPGRKGEQMPEEAMVAAYCSRVSQRSLWKVVLWKHKKARQVAKDYVAGLTAAKSQALEVPGEEVVATSSLRSLRSQKSLRAALSDASSRPSKSDLLLGSSCAMAGGGGGVLRAKEGTM
eukprot:s701_g15.t1